MITFEQVPVGASATLVGTVPPGANTVILTGAGGTGIVYLGNSTAVSSTIGAPLAGTGVMLIPGFSSSRQTTIYAVSSGGTVSIGFTISTES